MWVGRRHRVVGLEDFRRREDCLVVHRQDLVGGEVPRLVWVVHLRALVGKGRAEGFRRRALGDGSGLCVRVH